MVSVLPVDEDGLVQRIPGQAEVQPLHVELDLLGETLRVAAWPWPVGGGMGGEYRHIRTYSVAFASAEELDFLLADLAPLAEKVLAGTQLGTPRDDHAADLNPAAEAASAAIQARCSQATATLTPYDAEGYCDGGRPDDLHAESTNAEIKEMAADLDLEARDNNYLLTGTAEYLFAWRSQLREQEHASSDGES